MTPARVDQIAQGRVWDGGSARQLGLVDQFGGLDDALAYAAKQARLGNGDWHAEYLGADEEPYAPLLRRIWRRDDDEQAGGDMFSFFAARESGRAARVMSDLQSLLGMRGVQARCLECPAPALAPAASLASKGPLTLLVETLLR
jgi:protease IV